MKLFFFAIIIALSSATGFCQLAEFSFTKKTLTLKEVNEGELSTFSYSFKNTGKSPLLIESAIVTCNCTKVDYPKNPVAPGEIGVISVTFDTKGKYEYQDRTISIKANTKKPVKLRFKIYVIPAASRNK
jgi:hypothetical protein